MNQWTFVIAAYAATLAALAALLLYSLLSMRRAEAESARLQNRE